MIQFSSVLFDFVMSCPKTEQNILVYVRFLCFGFGFDFFFCSIFYGPVLVLLDTFWSFSFWVYYNIPSANLITYTKMINFF